MDAARQVSRHRAPVHDTGAVTDRFMVALSAVARQTGGYHGCRDRLPSGGALLRHLPIASAMTIILVGLVLTACAVI